MTCCVRSRLGSPSPLSSAWVPRPAFASWRSGSGSCTRTATRAESPTAIRSRRSSNGLRVADVEHRLTGLWELSIQSFVDLVGLLRQATAVDVLALAVHGARARAALGLSPAERDFVPAAEHAAAGQRARAGRVRPRPDGAAAHVPGARLRGHARQLRDQPRQRDRPRRRESVRGDAEPARGGLR